LVQLSFFFPVCCRCGIHEDLDWLKYTIKYFFV
jgi:hypothetical protein